MAKTSKRRQLSIEQESAIDLLITGKSDREVAELININRSTINHWQNHDSLFIAELNERRYELWNKDISRLKRLIGKSIDVLEKNLESKDSRLRQNAAVHILKAVGLYGMNLKPTGCKTPEGVEEGWKIAEKLTWS